MTTKLKVKLEDYALEPVRAHSTDAGLDLFSRDNDFCLWPGQSHFFDTGVHIQFPEGTYGLILSRSGLNMKHGIVAAGNGVIDQDYRGSIGVKLYNLGREGYTFKRGDRIAQLVIMDCYTPEIELVDCLDETDRNESGYGSTGR